MFNVNEKKDLIVGLLCFVFFTMLALSGVLWYFAGREVPAVQQHRVIETKYDPLDQTGEWRARGNTAVLEESRANLAPTEKRKVYSPVQPVEPAKNFLSPGVKEIVWWRTPKEQELKVGDWIKVIGWQGTFIGASLDMQTNKLRYSGHVDHVMLSPKEDGSYSSSHKIVGIIADVYTPRNKEDIVEINNTLIAQKNTIEWGARVKVLLTAKISAILPEAEQENKWIVISSNTDSHVVYYPY